MPSQQHRCSHFEDKTVSLDLFYYIINFSPKKPHYIQGLCLFCVKTYPYDKKSGGCCSICYLSHTHLKRVKSCEFVDIVILCGVRQYTPYAVQNLTSIKQLRWILCMSEIPDDLSFIYVFGANVATGVDILSETFL